MSSSLHYPDYLHEQTHPSHLYAVARLSGFEAPDPRGARILELACNAGSNLLPLAASLPGAELVGVDLDAARVRVGQEVVDAAGLSRARLVPCSVTEVDESFGSFDYIIAHGLFSWVGPEVREAILRLIAARLSPRGLAFVSYNTYPGWAVRMMAGEMFRCFGGHIADPRGWVEHARGLLDHLIDAREGRESALLPGLVAEAKRLKDHDVAYIHGEYNGHDHHPFFFHRFMADAGAHGLRWLGEARRLNTLLPDRYRPRDPALVPGFGADVVATQQYIDFVTERFFRQSILVRADAPPPAAFGPGAVPSLRVAAEVFGEGDVRSEGAVRYTAQGIEVRERLPLLKAALAALGDAWPQSIPFEALLEESRRRLAWAAKPDEEADRRRLAAWIFDAFVGDRVLLEPHASPAVRLPGPRPHAIPLARLQAARGERISTLRHEARSLDDAQRALLPLVDGRREVTALARDADARMQAQGLAPLGEGGVRRALQGLGALGVLIG